VNAPGSGRMAVQASLQDVARAVQALAQVLPPQLAQQQRHAIEIALAELLNNIVLHGFPGGGGAPIEVSWSLVPDAFVVELCDSGVAIPAAKLDAAGAATFDFDPDDLAALPQGGLGLAIVKAAFDRIDYRTEQGINCMHLEKSLA
jgi:serine/threonine-protein kinase RsbW